YFFSIRSNDKFKISCLIIFDQVTQALYIGLDTRLSHMKVEYVDEGFFFRSHQPTTSCFLSPNLILLYSFMLYLSSHQLRAETERSRSAHAVKTGNGRPNLVTAATNATRAFPTLSEFLKTLRDFAIPNPKVAI